MMKMAVQRLNPTPDEGPGIPDPDIDPPDCSSFGRIATYPGNLKKMKSLLPWCQGHMDLQRNQK